MNFDQEGYLADGKAAVEAGKKMTRSPTAWQTRATTPCS